MYNAAAVYAYHVQRLVGISFSVDVEAFYDSKSERAERLRRHSLQSDCLAGAFIKSIWPVPGRSTHDWKELQGLIGGDEPGEERLYGKTANVRMWLKRGFATGDAASCNTWTAPSSEVA
ncbi:hypothetical protein [Nonomuraea zeae]|uniref:Uncharacterized protein n=1 Tax=Nonomuraea zeae TaxID=1642303 RepID=A0A5S4GVF7_9ACTN|nr:hypothetical protein [Nonomuraea zeae]TMR36947.1 hypothetical protein ETD85_09350 [Nonomuraea zeae]